VTVMTEARTLRVAGLDLSMTATGIAYPNGTTETVKTKVIGDQRLVAITTAVLDACDGADLAVIEDLPTHAKSAGITGMVHGAVRAALLRAFVPYVLITPASVKKFATGKGNAGKPDMAVALFKRAGLEVGDDNQVDAWWLRAMALEYYGQPVVPMPALNRSALDAVKAWPAVEP
jgi:Holliday junction resolvasome RuvABC endonuclease subunit